MPSTVLADALCFPAVRLRVFAFVVPLHFLKSCNLSYVTILNFCYAFATRQYRRGRRVLKLPHTFVGSFVQSDIVTPPPPPYGLRGGNASYFMC